MAGLDPDSIRHALKTAQRHGYRFVRLKSDDETFRAVLSEGDSFSDTVPALAVTELSDAVILPSCLEVKSPCVGYFQPAKTTFAADEKVEAGAVVGHVEALGIRNDVVAKKGGTWIEYAVEPNQPVEFGQLIGTLKEGA